MKRLFFIYYVIFLVLFLSFPVLSADMIEMTNGKRYKGVILDYDQGLFFIKINGKTHFLLEDEISSIKWNSSDAELNEALKGETFKALTSRWGSIKIGINAFFETVPFFDEEFNDIYKGPMSHLGVSIGILTVGDRLSLKQSSIALSFMYNSSSGTATYKDYNSEVEYDTGIETSRLIVMFNLINKIYIFEGIPMVVFYELGLGASVVTNKLESYPLKSYEYWIWPPTEIIRKPMTDSYVTFAGRFSLGVYYSLTDYLNADISCGYFGMLPKSYKSINEAYHAYDAYYFIHGISFKAGLTFLF